MALPWSLRSFFRRRNDTNTTQVDDAHMPLKTVKDNARTRLSVRDALLDSPHYSAFFKSKRDKPTSSESTKHLKARLQRVLSPALLDEESTLVQNTSTQPALVNICSSSNEDDPAGAAHEEAFANEVAEGITTVHPPAPTRQLPVVPRDVSTEPAGRALDTMAAWVRIISPTLMPTSMAVEGHQHVFPASDVFLRKVEEIKALIMESAERHVSISRLVEDDDGSEESEAGLDYSIIQPCEAEMVEAEADSLGDESFLEPISFVSDGSSSTQTVRPTHLPIHFQSQLPTRSMRQCEHYPPAIPIAHGEDVTQAQALLGRRDPSNLELTSSTTSCFTMSPVQLSMRYVLPSLGLPVSIRFEHTNSFPVQLPGLSRLCEEMRFIEETRCWINDVTWGFRVDPTTAMEPIRHFQAWNPEDPERRKQDLYMLSSCYNLCQSLLNVWDHSKAAVEGARDAIQVLHAENHLLKRRVCELEKTVENMAAQMIVLQESLATLEARSGLVDNNSMYSAASTRMAEEAIDRVARAMQPAVSTTAKAKVPKSHAAAPLAVTKTRENRQPPLPASKVKQADLLRRRVISNKKGKMPAHLFTGTGATTHNDADIENDLIAFREIRNIMAHGRASEDANMFPVYIDGVPDQPHLNQKELMRAISGFLGTQGRAILDPVAEAEFDNDSQIW